MNPEIKAMKLAINYSNTLPIFKTIFFVLLLFSAQQAHALTYTVTNTNDGGFGSLRDALTQPAADIIEFNIPGAGVHTITRGVTPYPTITRSVTIDGTTQPGYAGVPLIEVNANGDEYGLRFDPDFAASYTWVVRGLIINRASSTGISITGSSPFNVDTTITGCYIGTNSSGTTDLGNGGSGISIGGSSAIIGGTGFGERNVISGNNASGIEFAASGYTVEIYNNYIGTNAAGTADLGNSFNGIYIGAASSTNPNIIGGTSGGGVNRGNVISGNNNNGIRLFSSAPVTVQRNLIGTSANGTAEVGNSRNGILIERGTGHLIGSSTSPTDRNIISGNGGAAGEGDGIKLLPSSGSVIVTGTQIFGNRIGTNSAGTAALQNLGDGIEINDSSNNQIGLAGNNAARNTISGNNSHGIVMSGSLSTGNIIQFNSIGTNQLLDDLGNGGDGIVITGAGTNTIGGGAANAGNAIGFNMGGYGVNINNASIGNTVRFNTILSNTFSGVNVSLTSNGNSIRQNSIYGNSLLGIDLGNNGVTLNDPNDADGGANLQQNFPVLQSATTARIAGTLNSIADQTFTIDFYRVDSCDASGYGEGRYHLASTNVTTVGNNVSFNFAYAGLNVGEIVTATATDAGGNTSEFSQCRTVANSGDLQLSAATYNVSESGGTAIVTVNRVGASNGTITVDYATSNGSATAGQDYTATSGTLTFLNGETTKTFPVPVINDTMDEPSETFNVSLSNPTGGALLLAPSTATVTITDNDNPPTISITDVSLEEGNSGTTNFTFNVSLSQASGFDVSVNYATANGTATAGSDYAAVNGTVNFSSALAETSKTVTIAVQGELLIEIDETFFVNLVTPVNATIADSQGIGTILDDDNPGRLQFSTSPYTTAEGSTFVFIFVTRTNGDAGTVTVDYTTTGGSATPTIDYTPESGTLVLGDGVTSADFRVPVLQDTQVEPTENFNIVLSNPLGGATLGALSTTTVNILDDDSGTLLAVGGRILKTDSSPLIGATVNLQGTQNAATTTDNNGDFNFPNLAPNGNFTVTPVALGYTFNPVAREYLNLTANVANANFTATATPTRQMRVIGGDTTPGNPVGAIVELVAQGDENSIGFSLNFDPAILSNPNVVLNPDAALAALTTNSSQTGKLGILLALPAGQSFAAGTKTLVTITFNTTATLAYSSPITFGDIPILRQIANANADPLPTNYLDSQVTFAQGYESDIAPRPTGTNNGSVTVADFTQVGRFVAGLDTPDQLNEFQRADSSPRISKGNGTLSVSDYTQAGRYAAGLDVVQTAGGQPGSGFRLDPFTEKDGLIPRFELPTADGSDFFGGNIVRVVNTSGSTNTQVLVSIETVANGDENGFGFSLNYDPAKLSNPFVALGTDTPTATLIPNTNTTGRVGVVLAMPFGQAIPTGTRQLVTIRFNIAANAPGGQTPLIFGDQPVFREVADTNGNPVPATFQDGNINIMPPTAATVSVGGRILTAYGQGIRNTRVSLTDAAGNTRNVITGSFGYYHFDEVAAGQTVILSVAAKRYAFTNPTRLITVIDEIGDADFIANEF